jgi:hypothetical protein
MLAKIGIVFVGAFALISVASAPAAAAPKPKPGDVVHIQGCVRKGVEGAKCMMVQTAGVTYDVSGLGLRIGAFAQGKATVSSNATTCQQGVLLENFKPEKVDHPIACGTAK